MKIVLLTNEYPPHIYGGAGVHVEHLSRELSLLEGGKHTVSVYCFGDQKQRVGNLIVQGVEMDFNFPFQDLEYPKLLDVLIRNIQMTGSVTEGDIVHCHTWYPHLAGCFIKHLLGVPLVLTTHSLEPQRPWKAEQLGVAYHASAWLEKTAYENADGVIAVSGSMKNAVHELYHVPFERMTVIPNGINVNEYVPTFNPDLLASYHINPRKPYLLFVGRITRQKGLTYLIDAIPWLDEDIQVVLCAGTPDTREIGKEMAEKVKEVRTRTNHEILWIEQWVPRLDLICLFSHASVFVCPSIYEPFGIINLEAMACETPVVASAVGGIVEVVVDGETGVLVGFQTKAPHHVEPKDPEKFSYDLATAINDLFRSPEKRNAMGVKSRERVEKYYSWESVARQTLEFYRKVTGSKPASY